MLWYLLVGYWFAWRWWILRVEVFGWGCSPKGRRFPRWFSYIQFDVSLGLCRIYQIVYRDKSLVHQNKTSETYLVVSDGSSFLPSYVLQKIWYSLERGCNNRMMHNSLGMFICIPSSWSMMSLASVMYYSIVEVLSFLIPTNLLRNISRCEHGLDWYRSLSAFHKLYRSSNLQTTLTTKSFTKSCSACRARSL